MSFFRIFPEKDTWITDKTLGVGKSASGSNHGRDPSLEIFSLLPEGVTSGSKDQARALLQFSMTELSGKVFDEGVIPTSGVQYLLKMFEMGHDETVPSSYDLFAYPLSRSWDEGNGIDADNFLDVGYANWLDSTSTTSWSTTGSDFITSLSASQHFDQGDGDLEVDITSIVNEWLSGSLTNNGIVLKLGDTEEGNSIDYYVKKFHGRETKFVDRIPYIEARWNDVRKDHRSNVILGVASNLTLYNVVRGELTAASDPLTVQVKDSLLPGSASFSASQTPLTVESGIYSSSFTIPKGDYESVFYDIWTDSGGDVLMTGTFVPINLTSSQVDIYDEFDLEVTNLKRVYRTNEEARLIVNVRKRDYKHHVGFVSTGSLEMEREYIEKMYFSVVNDVTGEVVVPFGTGSLAHTQLSYNGDGNYFNLWFGGFVPGFKYRMLFLIDFNQYDKKVIDEDITFKVV